MYDIIIIGAGPAGLFSALTLSGSGKKILVLEKNSSAGKKLLLSGSGQCNLTHSGEVDSFFSKYGTKSNFIKPAILNFSNRD
jgi:predicted flavoprotein YhiN